MTRSKTSDPASWEEDPAPWEVSRWRALRFASWRWMRKCWTRIAVTLEGSGASYQAREMAESIKVANSRLYEYDQVARVLKGGRHQLRPIRVRLWRRAVCGDAYRGHREHEMQSVEYEENAGYACGQHELAGMMWDQPTRSRWFLRTVCQPSPQKRL